MIIKKMERITRRHGDHQEEISPKDLNIKIYLAKKIINAQGGSITFLRKEPGSEAVSSIEISLPSEAGLEVIQIRKDIAAADIKNKVAKTTSVNRSFYRNIAQQCDEWQDEDRIWTTVEQVYETRWDCPFMPEGVRLNALLTTSI